MSVPAGNPKRAEENVYFPYFAENRMLLIHFKVVVFRLSLPKAQHERRLGGGCLSF